MGGQKTSTKSQSSQTATNTGDQAFRNAGGWNSAQNLMGQVNNVQPFSGQFEAAPGQPQQVAQYGTTPSVFVVKPHDQGTITNAVGASQAAGNLQQPGLESLVGNYNQIAQGPNTSYVQNQEAALRDLNNQNLEGQTGSLMQNFGSVGGVGSGNLAKAIALNNQANATTFNNTIAGYEANNYNNWLNTISQLPQMYQAAFEAQMNPANAQIGYGDLTQQNAQADAANQYDKWLADYQAAQAAAGQANANTDWATQVAQTGLDNNLLSWTNQQETLNNKIQQLQGIANIYGSTGDQNQTGQSTSTTTTKTSPMADALGVLGAGLQAFAPGGIFAGSLSALGGGALKAGAIGGASPITTPLSTSQLLMPQFAPAFAPSDRRLKKNINPLGDGWYEFHYLWDDPSEPKHIGVMADEVDPRFVTEQNGYKYVNYKALLESQNAMAD